MRDRLTIFQLNLDRLVHTLHKESGGYAVSDGAMLEAAYAKSSISARGGFGIMLRMY